MPGAGMMHCKSYSDRTPRERGQAGALAGYWLLSGVIVLAIWQMVQTGHHLLFKQTHFSKHKLLLFFTCVSVRI